MIEGSKLWAAAAGLIALTSPDLARDPPDEPASDEQSLCLGGPRWSPHPTEVARIESEPIPASFRQVITARCASMMRYEVRLVEWHLAFGSEASTNASLRYMERALLGDAPRPADYLRDLRRARRSAFPDVRRALAMERRPGVSASVRHRFLGDSRTYRQFERLARARNAYLLVAQQYLRAAEEFGSASMLAKAEIYLQPVLDGARAIQPAETQERAYFELDNETLTTDDLRMRIAVTNAQMTRAPDDLARAEAVLGEFYRPLYRDAADHAFEAGSSFCDFNEDDERRSAVNEACHREHDFSHRVINYWINRAILDLVSGFSEPRDRLALRLLEHERLSRSAERYGDRRSEDDMRRILLARAGMRSRDFAVKIAEPEPHDARQPWRSALNDLEQAERLTPPFDQPRRFRLIAEAWLALYAHADALDSPEDPHTPRSASPARQRYATYLRRLLIDLEAIAIGADGAPR